jgi:hypothetical protein
MSVRISIPNDSSKYKKVSGILSQMRQSLPKSAWVHALFHIFRDVLKGVSPYNLYPFHKKPPHLPVWEEGREINSDRRTEKWPA